MARWLLGGLLALVLAVAASGYWAWLRLHEPLRLDAPLLIEIERGMSLGAVVGALAERDILSAPEVVRLWARWTGQASQMHVGEYRLQPGMNALALLDAMAAGDVVRRRFTIVEGWRFHDLRRALANAEKVTARTTALADQAVMAELGRPGVHPEGRFFPDTYLYEAGTTDLELLQRAAARMDQVLAEEWARRDPALPLERPDEALILASLVEKETGVAAERAKVAAVFVRRLQRGMRLQTDPTVVYGLGEHYEPPLSRKDLRQPTPWNTYVHHGLPPTPIAMPGRAALQAALNPAETDALYFVARGDGSSHFSATLEEHNSAVWRFLRRPRLKAEAADDDDNGTEEKHTE